MVVSVAAETALALVAALVAAGYYFDRDARVSRNQPNRSWRDESLQPRTITNHDGSVNPRLKQYIYTGDYQAATGGAVNGVTTAHIYGGPDYTERTERPDVMAVRGEKAERRRHYYEPYAAQRAHNQLVHHAHAGLASEHWRLALANAGR